jgi:hypothetical protein
MKRYKSKKPPPVKEPKFRTVGELCDYVLKRRKNPVFTRGKGREEGLIMFNWQDMPTVVNEGLPLEQLLEMLRCTEKDLMDAKL